MGGKNGGGGDTVNVQLDVTTAKTLLQALTQALGSGGKAVTTKGTKATGGGKPTGAKPKGGK